MLYIKAITPPGRGKAILVLHIWGKRRKEGNEGGREKRKVFLHASWISQIP